MRERRSNTPELVAHLLAKANRDAAPRLTENALAVLCDYAWPGNVRELENAYERLTVIAAGANRITRRDVCAALLVSTEGAPASTESGARLWERGESLDEYLERQKCGAIRAALAHTRGNVAASARLLKVSRPGLSKYLTRAKVRVAAGAGTAWTRRPMRGSRWGRKSGTRASVLRRAAGGSRLGAGAPEIF